MTAEIHIAGVSERDIDLLLLEELLSSDEFRAWFILQVMGTDFTASQFLGAKRSITHSTGESDLEVAFEDPTGNRVLILVENKVGAGFQPQQASA